jgi:predicted Abi (CAAX) family protease
MKIKIKRKWLSIGIVVFMFLPLLFAYGWMNGMVSYKYEVQDTYMQACRLMSINRIFYRVLPFVKRLWSFLSAC